MKLLAGTTWLASLAVLAPLAAAGDTAGTETPRSTWDGVFTQAQAERGQRLLDLHCAACHAGNLHGTQAAPAIAGPEMLFVWDGRSLAELFEYMRRSMPPGQAGSLGDEEYVAVIATILQHSGFPVSERQELPADHLVLQQTIIRRENPRPAGG